jgi:hypothetical protein
MPIRTVIPILLACAANALAAEPAARDKNESDKIDKDFRSPDGLFGMQVIKDPENNSRNDQVVLVEWATKRVLKVLSDPERPEYTDKARLDWSPDSKRVAAYTGGRHDGDTKIFVRDGDTFAEVKMPDLPELPDKPSPKVAKQHKAGFPRMLTEYDLKFDRWLPSGVVLNFSNCHNGPDGSLIWKIELTLEIDANRQAKIKRAVKKETVHEG